jgi:hypothetical protein
MATKPSNKKKKKAYRSKLEANFAYKLEEDVIGFSYEPYSIPYSIAEERRYYPDFIILANGIIIETKGYFKPADRKKHLRIKEQYPDLDIRFVFGNKKNKINKNSKTTYEDWCNNNGFKCCDQKDTQTIWDWAHEVGKKQQHERAKRKRKPK